MATSTVNNNSSPAQTTGTSGVTTGQKYPVLGAVNFYMVLNDLFQDQVEVLQENAKNSSESLSTLQEQQSALQKEIRAKTDEKNAKTEKKNTFGKSLGAWAVVGALVCVAMYGLCTGGAGLIVAAGVSTAIATDDGASEFMEQGLTGKSVEKGLSQNDKDKIDDAIAQINDKISEVSKKQEKITSFNMQQNATDKNAASQNRNSALDSMAAYLR